MQVTLDAESAKLVTRQLELGHAQNAAEAVAQALISYSVAHDDEAWVEEEKEWLETRMAKADDEIQRGEIYSADEARAELARRRGLRPSA